MHLMTFDLDLDMTKIYFMASNLDFGLHMSKMYLMTFDLWPWPWPDKNDWLYARTVNISLLFSHAAQRSSMIQKVAQKVARKVPKPNFRFPTTAKSSPVGSFSSNLATTVLLYSS